MFLRLVFGCGGGVLLKWRVMMAAEVTIDPAAPSGYDNGWCAEKASAVRRSRPAGCRCIARRISMRTCSLLFAVALGGACLGA